MRNAILWPLLCAGLLCTTTAPAEPIVPACQSTVSGDLRLHPLDSRIFGNTRTIRVLLPPGYDAPENRAGATRCCTCSTARTCSTPA